ncbi:MAG: hypothetical protein RIC38_16550, partial [Chromatocurvus sp.]
AEIPLPIPESQIHPRVASVLEPGEQVLWQEEPPRKSLWFSAVLLLVIVGVFVWQEGLLQDAQALIESDSLSTLIVVVVIALLLIGGFIGLVHYRRDSSVYVLTSHRVMRTFRGGVAQQATPEKLQFRGSPRSGSVHWYNLDFPPDSHSRGRHGFANVKDGVAVYRLLEAWQNMKIQADDKRAEASSDAYRRRARADEAGFQPDASPDAAKEPDASPITDETPAPAPAPAPARKITHSKHGFSLDVPGSWDVQVGRENDGPLKILGITLIKHIVRPAALKPYEPTDASWNRLTLRGGPSTGLTMKINPGRMYSEHEVLNDRWGKMLGVDVKFFERDIDISGFRGFAAVREFPAGSSPLGFGTLPLPVISRQWWLTGHGLNLEIQGIAPLESTALQDTIDLTVASLRPETD